ncbi:MAG: hypothetical protein ACR2GN_01605 [Bacteroidia bacterium]
MKKLIGLMVSIIFTLNIATAQEAAKQAVENAAADQSEGPVDFTEALGSDLDLTDEQRKEIQEINQNTWNQYYSIDDAYKTSDEVYENRVRVILEERDAKMNDVLTLDQYAIYLKNRAQYQEYDSRYYSSDLKMRKDADGKVKVKTDEGTIKITDDKIKIKNEETGTKTKIKDDKVKVKTADGEKIKVKQSDDKVKIKTDDAKVKVKEDGAEVKTDEKKIEINEVND